MIADSEIIVPSAHIVELISSFFRFAWAFCHFHVS